MYGKKSHTSSNRENNADERPAFNAPNEIVTIDSLQCFQLRTRWNPCQLERLLDEQYRYFTLGDFFRLPWQHVLQHPGFLEWAASYRHNANSSDVIRRSTCALCIASD